MMIKKDLIQINKETRNRLILVAIINAFANLLVGIAIVTNDRIPIKIILSCLFALNVFNIYKYMINILESHRYSIYFNSKLETLKEIEKDLDKYIDIKLNIKKDNNESGECLND